MRKRIVAVAIFAWSMSVFESRAQTVVAGYNAGLAPGLNLVGLHVENGQDQTFTNIFRIMPEESELYKVLNGVFTTNVYLNGVWERPNNTVLEGEDTLVQGEGVFIFNPAAETFIHGFGGSISQGYLTNFIPAGLSIRASMAPKGGKLTQDLGLRLNAFDNVYILEEGALKVFTYLPDGTWRPFEPVVRLSEAFLINAAQATNWVMEFEI